MSSKSKIIIGPGAIVCKESELVGEITIGGRTVIHPKARIIAEGGPIIIGESNLIEEQVQIINKGNPKDPDSQVPMIIGSNNVFEVGAYIESMKIGDNNVLESKCTIGKYTQLTSGCVIGAKCELVCNEIIPENTVIYGSTCERRHQAEKPAPQTLQLDFLTKILPNYHHLRKPTRIESKSRRKVTIGVSNYR
ncbi:dynactin subunit 6-like [Argiope bruennichi]|uniref:Dynactin subunit 6 n=1 Tax=Argiope bruennichi TaxID=94029 RepID=A0A8T0DXJ8_ARGBR|nr:dynactin subunit 6-like [Argiope bruennichi]KAF8763238.1 Dynactin subunit 6 like protein [Argiope bruennichi]